MPSGKEIKSAQLGERRIPVVINADASTPTLVIGGNQVTLVRNGAGDYTLTLKSLFQYTRAPILFGIGIESGSPAIVVQGTSTVSAIQVLIFDDAGVAADIDVNVEIVGWDKSDEI